MAHDDDRRPPRRRRSRDRDPEDRPPRGQQRRSRQARDPGRKKKKALPKMVDLHIRLGLEDHLVRIAIAGWETILMSWMLGREDVILRGAFRGQEKNIILRGEESGSLRIRAPKEGVNVAMFTVIRAVDMRMEVLRKSGH